MKFLTRMLSKYIVSLTAVIALLFISNLALFVASFYGIVHKDYGTHSPNHILDLLASYSSAEAVPKSVQEQLYEEKIWALALDGQGKPIWSLFLPEGLDHSYSAAEIAQFSRGYLKDYPVFVRTSDTGLILAGYPADSFGKIVNNYYSLEAIRRLPLFFLMLLVLDAFLLFLIYYVSKKRLAKSVVPILESMEDLGNGRAVSLPENGQWAELSHSINLVSKKLSKQNQARINWINGVSHDIRTPLSMMMAYADRIVTRSGTPEETKKEAEIITAQSLRVKKLVEDLNLISQLEYEDLPLSFREVPLAKFLRQFVVKLLNDGLEPIYEIALQVSSELEGKTLPLDERLIDRALQNLVSNSISHNSKGCHIDIEARIENNDFFLTVSDDGKGMSADALRRLEGTGDYLESLDDNLSLRHGLGLHIVGQIIKAHHGVMSIQSEEGVGFQTTIQIPMREAAAGTLVRMM